MADKMPPEILSKIFGTHGRTQADLLSWLRVCLAWYEPAKEELYRRIPVSVNRLSYLDEAVSHCGPGEVGERRDLQGHAKTPLIEELSIPDEEAVPAEQCPLPLNLLLKSLESHPENGHYICGLELRIPSGLALLPSCPRLRTLAIQTQSPISRRQAMQKLAYHTFFMDDPIFSFPTLPLLRTLRLCNVEPDLAVEILSLCPTLQRLELFGIANLDMWPCFHYPALPPLAQMALSFDDAAISHKAFSKLLGPVSQGLKSLSMVLCDLPIGATPVPEDGDVTSLSLHFWTGLELPVLRKLQLCHVDLDGVPRILATAKELVTLDLRGPLRITGVYAFIRNFPSTLSTLRLALSTAFLVQSDEDVAEAFISCLSDAAWLPRLKSMPQIWTQKDFSRSQRKGYMARIEETCCARGLKIKKRVKETLFTHDSMSLYPDWRLPA